MGTEYTLYGGELSLFTGKARAYMRYKGLDYQELAADREVYKTIILPNVGAPIVPVVVAGSGKRLIDSFSQWMFQHSFDHYHSLDDGLRQGVDELLTTYSNQPSKSP